MFTLPEDITALSAPDLDAMLSQAREYANKVLTETPNDVDALNSAKAAFGVLIGEKTQRENTEALRSELAAAVAEPQVPDEPETPAEPQAPAAPPAEPVAVTASAAPAPPVAAPRAPRSTIDAPAPDSGPELAVMLVAPDVPGMAGGQRITSFATAAEALTNRLRAYPKPSSTRRSSTPVPSRSIGNNGAFSLDVTGRSYVRHGGVVLKRQFPEELRLTTGSEDEYERVKKFATAEKRLPGGSLLKSAKQQMANGRALTAAVGWCAPSETIYNLCDLSSMDGLLDLPEIQASRGGFHVPADGGPDFSVIWNGIGDSGDVVLTEYDIENGALKECFTIPCPDFEEVRLDAAYVCLTGSLLQRRTYPEVVELFTQQAMKALAHKINQSVISRIVDASGAAVVIPADASGDDAASGILSAVDLAVQDIKYRERMSRDSTLEVVLPYWALAQIRAAMARRYGIGRLDVTDQMILDWFEVRDAMPRFVYDWQDSFSGLNTGPGGATPLTVLPTTVQFLIYPAGTWTKIVQDVVSLDTIYDNAMLTSNEYTAVFTEDGFNVIQTCPISRLYTAQADPSGVVGCCP
jgi:hypothetical protein